MAEYRPNFFFMSSTDWRRASSNEGAFLMTSSTSWRTCSRRWADLRARSVFQGFSSSRDNAMLTSIVSFLHIDLHSWSCPIAARDGRPGRMTAGGFETPRDYSTRRGGRTAARGGPVNDPGW